jgi:hypothetical protein
MEAYDQFKRVFRQAPWRAQTQVAAAAAVFFLVMAALGGLYLATATRAATAGRDVQRLEAEKTDLLHELDRLQAEIAAAQSVSRLEARARELGYVPANTDQVEYLVVPGYPAAPPAETAPPEADTVASLPDYDETLASWLAERLQDWSAAR